MTNTSPVSIFVQNAHLPASNAQTYAMLAPTNVKSIQWIIAGNARPYVANGQLNVRV